MTRTAAAFVFTLTMSAAAGAQWPQWRGPARDAVLPADAVPADWPEKALLKWRQPIGEGYSSPVVEGGRVFVHSRRDPQEIVTAIDLASGRPAWSDSYEAPFAKNQYAREMARGRARARSATGSNGPARDGRRASCGTTRLSPCT